MFDETYYNKGQCACHPFDRLIALIIVRDSAAINLNTICLI